MCEALPGAQGEQSEGRQKAEGGRRVESSATGIRNLPPVLASRSDVSAPMCDALCCAPQNCSPPAGFRTGLARCVLRRHGKNAAMGDFDTSGENTMHQEEGFTSMAPVVACCLSALFAKILGG